MELKGEQISLTELAAVAIGEESVHLSSSSHPRILASRKLIEGAGGSVESFYFALGEDDVYIVCDLPDNATAAAASMNVAASGMVVNRMVALLTAEEVDRAAAAKMHYDAPGS